MKASAVYSMLPFIAMLVCCCWGSDERPDHEMARAAFGPVWRGGVRNRGRRNLHRVRLASAKRAAGQCCPGRRGRRSLSVAEFILVGDSRYRGRVVRFCLRIHEHGQPDRGGDHCFADAVDRDSIRVDGVLSDGRSFVPGGCGVLARGRPNQDAGSGTEHTRSRFRSFAHPTGESIANHSCRFITTWQS